jgi:hypothetical protein
MARRDDLSAREHGDLRGVPNEPASAPASYELTPEQERDVLDFDPWGERDATYRVLRSGFARCKKPHSCDICFGPIAAGDRVWARAEVDDGAMKTFRFCPECCWCIARRYDESLDEDGHDFGFTRLYERWEIGRKRAEDARSTTGADFAEIQEHGSGKATSSATDSGSPS